MWITMVTICGCNFVCKNNRRGQRWSCNQLNQWGFNMSALRKTYTEFTVAATTDMFAGEAADMMPCSNIEAGDLLAGYGADLMPCSNIETGRAADLMPCSNVKAGDMMGGAGTALMPCSN